MRPIARTIAAKSTFIPGGCLHWPIGDKDLLKAWVRAVATAEGGFTVLMGDTLDCARTHYRDHVRGYRQDENSQAALDEYVKEDVRKLVAVLVPIKDRIIGAIRGNHYWEFSDGTNSEQYLCQLLGIHYFGPVGVIRLEVRGKDGEKNTVLHKLVLYCHHSGGGQGGRTTGGDANALERSEQVFDADIYCLSHTHRRYATKLPKLCLTAKGIPRVREKTLVFVRSGAFLKGYNEDSPSPHHPHVPSYAEVKALRPTDLGWVEVGINIVRTTSAKDKLPGETMGPHTIRVEMSVRY